MRNDFETELRWLVQERWDDSGEIVIIDELLILAEHLMDECQDKDHVRSRLLSFFKHTDADLSRSSVGSP